MKRRNSDTPRWTEAQAANAEARQLLEDVKKDLKAAHAAFARAGFLASEDLRIAPRRGDK